MAIIIIKNIIIIIIIIIITVNLHKTVCNCGERSKRASRDIFQAGHLWGFTGNPQHMHCACQSQKLLRLSPSLVGWGLIYSLVYRYMIWNDWVQ